MSSSFGGQSKGGPAETGGVDTGGRMSLDFSKRKALIVEDNDFVRFTIKKNLMDFGFGEVYEAGNGMEGLEQLSKNPDIVICDINMEPVNGHEFLQHLRKAPGMPHDLPVIFLTSSGDTQSVHRAINLEVDAYLLKPVNPDALKKKLVALMTRMADA